MPLTRFWEDEHGMVVEGFDESCTQLDACRADARPCRAALRN